jgi:sensor histidine kinase YesM
VAGMLLVSVPNPEKFNKRLLSCGILLGISCAIDGLCYFLLVHGIEESGRTLFASSVSVLLFLTCSIFFRSFGRNNSDVPDEKWWELTTVTIVSVGLLVLIVESEKMSVISIVYICSAVLLLNFVLYYLHQTLKENYEKTLEKAIVDEQILAYEKQLLLNREQEDRVRALKHDMRNHLTEISLLAKSGAIEDLKSYIHSMDSALQPPEKTVDSGNFPIDGIINQKMEEAAANGIPIDCKLTIPSNLSLNSFDITVLLGNLLDNAIEGCTGCKEPHIELELAYAGGCMLIRVSNPYERMLSIKNGKLLSTKNDGKKHGYGMYGIHSIVEKYGGNIQIHHEEGIFDVQIEFPLPLYSPTSV